MLFPPEIELNDFCFKKQNFILCKLTGNVKNGFTFLFGEAIHPGPFSLIACTFN